MVTSTTATSVSGRTQAAIALVEALWKLEEELQAECVVPVEVVLVEALLLHEAHASVETQCSKVSHLSLKHALVRTQLPHPIKAELHEGRADFPPAEFLLHGKHGDVAPIGVATHVHVQFADDGSNTPILLHGEETEIRPIVNEVAVREHRVGLGEILLNELHDARHVTLVFVGDKVDIACSRHYAILRRHRPLGGGRRRDRHTAFAINACAVTGALGNCLHALRTSSARAVSRTGVPASHHPPSP
mmetsp:Transcript_100240/g.214735  ORF Transcript_100240/g.214735 Transcript_100240/m.214735 type:complete len:246 (-) Transcript_100240:13-750(-)